MSSNCDKAKKDIDRVAQIGRKENPQFEEDTVAHIALCLNCMKYAIEKLKPDKAP